MINRNELENKLQDTLNGNVKKKRFVDSINQLMKTNHNITAGETNAFLFGKKKLEEITIEELYWLSQSVSNVLVDVNLDLEKYFTSHEIVAYGKSKRENRNLDKYPIVFENVLQVGTDQWVTTVDTNVLYDMYKNQVINYNKNTQRPSTVREKDGIVEYKISVNQQSVNEIASLMKQKLFIPNAITLNVNLDNPNAEFEYRNGEFTLFAGNYDITDGFHRYMAMMKNKMEDEMFNYPCILNITNFDETKACNYIAQEDKRNKIKKSFAKSMDSTNPVNIVIQRLNDDSRCYLYGQIGRTETDKVNAIYLHDLISHCFKIKDRSEIVEIVKYLKEIINTLIEDELLETDFISLAIVIKGAAMYQNDNNYIDKIEHLVNNKGQISKDKFKNCKVTKILLNEIESLERR